MSLWILIILSLHCLKIVQLLSLNINNQISHYDNSMDSFNHLMQANSKNTFTETNIISQQITPSVNALIINHEYIKFELLRLND